MRKLLELLIFPFFLAYSILEALIAKPFKFKWRHNEGLEIGIVPLVVIILIVYFLSR